MQIQHTDDGKRGAFFIKEQDETLAEMIYKWSDESTFIIEHTEVSDKLAGKGVGKQLVMLQSNLRGQIIIRSSRFVLSPGKYLREP
jgi:predicted GNAT family acetyltransferase